MPQPSHLWFLPRNRSRHLLAAVGAAVLAVVLSRPAVAAVPATTSWEQIVPPPGGPGVRAWAAAVYHPGRRALMLFGGADGAIRHNDLWSLSLEDGGGWTQIIRSFPPSRRIMHSMILCPGTDQLVLFGGLGVGLLNDVRVLGLGLPSWTTFPGNGTPPDPRAGHIAIYDPPRNRMLVIGGWDYGPLNDVWEYAPPGSGPWHQLSPSGSPMPGRGLAAAVYDPVRDRVVIFGGDGGTFLNDVWALNLSSGPVWEELHPSGTPPEPRREATAIYDPIWDRIIVYGGYDGGPRDDLWALNLYGSPSWTPLTSSTAGPAGRNGHVAILDPVRHQMIVFGGKTDDTHYSDEVWALNLDAPTPVALSLASTEVQADFVRITWATEQASGLSAAVQRSTGATGEWSEVGSPALSGSDRLVFEDRAVTPGARYGYRLVVSQGGQQVTLDPVWVTVPQPAVLVLSGATPNPSEAGISVRFSLASDAPARLELFDLKGRLVAQREVGPLGAGEHLLPLADRADLSAGVYLVRLTQDRRVLTAKACVVR